jgi:hypothetical protein
VSTALACSEMLNLNQEEDSYHYRKNNVRNKKAEIDVRV